MAVFVHWAWVQFHSTRNMCQPPVNSCEFTQYYYMLASCCLYVAGRFHGRVDIRAGNTICGSLKSPVTSCGLTCDVYIVDCAQTVRARFVEIIQKTKQPSQLRVCEVGLKTLYTRSTTWSRSWEWGATVFFEDAAFRTCNTDPMLFDRKIITIFRNHICVLVLISSELNI